MIRYKLADLLVGLEPREEIDFGLPVGREFGAEGWDDVGEGWGGSTPRGDGGTEFIDSGTRI